MASEETAHSSTGVGGDLVSAYAGMRLIRRFEELLRDQHAAELVPGPLHLALGQEAVAVGACSALRPSDGIVSTHRGHHHCLAKGASPARLLAEIMGRKDGYTRGRGGSMHVAVPELGLLGTNGIVGAGLPIAVGAAFGAVVQERDDVVVCFFGEGASSEGTFGESLNLASLWRLPVVFLCENNRYAEMTHESRHVAGRVWKRGEGYDVPGEEVDGNDVDAVARVVATAVARGRSGEGPTLVETVTYRWAGHYVGDPERYRPVEEVQEWITLRDPLARVRHRLDPAVAEQVDLDVERELNEALAFALASPPTSADELSLDHQPAP
jgi:TPP-dependent pyruvate/acetoin dehydrogenase alpha subunit